MRLSLCSLTLIGCATEAHPTEGLGRALLPTRFGFPLLEQDMVSTRVGVDHDPVTHEGVAASALCKDYLGRNFPHCYDEHHGTDFILEGGFQTMDEGSIWVVAGYSGWVTTVVDGNYDRCHTDLGAITCDGHPVEPNYIVIEHPDGIRSEYIHLMKDSIVVEEGQEVQCGDLLGRVGSSGYSSMPHLHFEVELDGEWIDPYAGPFSQAESLWELQGNDFSLPEPGCTAR
jgi:hypothetical protein